MSFLIKRPSDIAPSEITSPELFARRREFIKAAGLAAGSIGLSAMFTSGGAAAAPLSNVKKSALSVTEKPNSLEDITSYNNYYEFGTSKEEPEMLAQRLVTRPWTVSIEGEVKKPRTIGIATRSTDAAFCLWRRARACTAGPRAGTQPFPSALLGAPGS